MTCSTIPLYCQRNLMKHARFSSSKVLSHSVETQYAAYNRSDLNVHTNNLSRKPGNVRILRLYKRAQLRHAHVLLNSFLYLCKFLFFLNGAWMLFSSLSWRRLDILGELSALTIGLQIGNHSKLFKRLTDIAFLQTS
jgi:hypothetical protein